MDSTLMTIAIFKVQPLELLANIPIDKKVGRRRRGGGGGRGRRERGGEEGEGRGRRERGGGGGKGEGEAATHPFPHATPPYCHAHHSVCPTS